MSAAATAATNWAGTAWSLLLGLIQRIDRSGLERRRLRIIHAAYVLKKSGQRWNALRCLPDDQKAAWRDSFLRYERDYRFGSTLAYRAEGIGVGFAVLLFFCTVIIAPSFVRIGNIGLADTGFWPRFLSIYAFIGLFLALCYPFWIVDRLFGQRREALRFGRHSLLLTGIVICLAGFVLFRYQQAHPHGVVASLLAFIILTAAVPLAFLLALAPLFPLIAIANRIGRSKHWHAHIVHELFETIRDLEQIGACGDSGDRARISNRLDRVAALIGKGLLGQFQTHDPITQTWLDQRVRRIANAFREKRKWLITPKADTIAHLQSALAASIGALLSGAWDELELADDPVITRRALVVMVVAAVRAVILAALPLAVFLAARRLALLPDLSREMSSYIEMGLFVWAVVSLLLIVDPAFKEKIDVVNRVKSLVKGGNENSS